MHACVLQELMLLLANSWAWANILQLFGLREFNVVSWLPVVFVEVGKSERCMGAWLLVELRVARGKNA